jgi:hypothetical protein
MNVERINQTIETETTRAMNRYNAENDIIPGTPVVTWADQTAYEQIIRLLHLVENLQQRVEELEKK